MSTIPIPQDASVQQPIPDGALVESSPGAGVSDQISTNSQRAALEQSGAIPKSHPTNFSKTPPGTREAMTSEIPAPIRYGIEAAPLLTGIGPAVEGASAAAVPTARAIGTAAGTAVRLARTPLGQATIKAGIEIAKYGVGIELLRKWLTK